MTPFERIFRREFRAYVSRHAPANTRVLFGCIRGRADVRTVTLGGFGKAVSRIAYIGHSPHAYDGAGPYTYARDLAKEMIG